MKKCTPAEFNGIATFYRQSHLDRAGILSADRGGSLKLTLRSKTLPVFPNREGFLDIESGGRIPLEKRLDVVADSVSKPKWEIYAIYDPNTGTHYYDYQNLFLQSMIEGEEWQKQDG